MKLPHRLFLLSKKIYICIALSRLHCKNGPRNVQIHPDPDPCVFSDLDRPKLTKPIQSLAHSTDTASWPVFFQLGLFEQPWLALGSQKLTLKGISPKMCIFCCVRDIINKRSFEPFCVWISQKLLVVKIIIMIIIITYNNHCHNKNHTYIFFPALFPAERAQRACSHTLHNTYHLVFTFTHITYKQSHNTYLINYTHKKWHRDTFTHVLKVQDGSSRTWLAHHLLHGDSDGSSRPAWQRQSSFELATSQDRVSQAGSAVSRIGTERHNEISRETQTTDWRHE